MRDVTGQEVRSAVMAAGLTYIPHHDCSICGVWVAYVVMDGDLYFDSACGCSWSPMRSAPWSEAANWINMQTNDGVREKLMSSFGMTV